MGKMDQSEIIETFPTKENLGTKFTGLELKSFDVYYEESLFGLTLIARDIAALDKNSTILEFGSGIGLIASHLANLGFKVTSLEPSEQGFGMMSRLQKVVELHYSNNLSTASHLNLKIEDYSSNSKFDYIFAINVLEHVENEELAIASSKALLNVNGKLRLINPNYAFPYEPHFNIPIIFGKKFTHILFWSKIQEFPIYDSLGTWSSLNWVSTWKIARIAKKLEIKVTFGRESWNSYLERISIPGEFSRRKGPILRVLAPKIARIFALIPIWFIPITDATFTLE